jgi:hypothetical protein
LSSDYCTHNQWVTKTVTFYLGIQKKQPPHYTHSDDNVNTLLTRIEFCLRLRLKCGNAKKYGVSALRKIFHTQTKWIYLIEKPCTFLLKFCSLSNKNQIDKNLTNYSSFHKLLCGKIKIKSMLHSNIQMADFVRINRGIICTHYLATLNEEE